MHECVQAAASAGGVPRAPFHATVPPPWHADLGHLQQHLCGQKSRLRHSPQVNHLPEARQVVPRQHHLRRQRRAGTCACAAASARKACRFTRRPADFQEPDLLIPKDRTPADLYRSDKSTGAAADLSADLYNVNRGFLPTFDISAGCRDIGCRDIQCKVEP